MCNLHFYCTHQVITVVLVNLFATLAAADSSHQRAVLVSRAAPLKKCLTNFPTYGESLGLVSPRISNGVFSSPWVPIVGPTYAKPSTSLLKISPTLKNLNPSLFGTPAHNWVAVPVGPAAALSAQVPIAASPFNSVPSAAAKPDVLVYAAQLPLAEILTGHNSAQKLLGPGAAYLPYGDLRLYNAYEGLYPDFITIGF